MSKPTLRDTLAAGLDKLPNATRLGLTVASSTPKRTTALFPYASPSSFVRCLESEHLVVVDCGLPADADGAGTAPQSVLAAAISVHLYTLPDKSSVVYISKVDSSGYASTSPGLTRELAIGVLTHFLSPATRPTPKVTATLFARSQGQYLFPNSIEGGGKRVLGGLGLCNWWKSVYEGAAKRLVDDGAGPHLQLRYLLPSYSAAEAKGMLRADASPIPWSYAPPFIGSSLATLIPSLPDDPKTRFLDELAAEALDIPHAPAQVQPQPTADCPTSPRKRKRELEDEEDRKRTHAALNKVPADEFWERIGFRQECSSGDVTGFFAMTVDGEAGKEKEKTGKSENEKSENETSENETQENEKKEKEREENEKKEKDIETEKETPAKADKRTTLPTALVERLLKSLLNTDFGTRALAADGTQGWLDSARRLVIDEVGEDGWAACIASVDAKAGERVERKRKEEVVTVLQVRKKKK